MNKIKFRIRGLIYDKQGLQNDFLLESQFGWAFYYSLMCDDV